MGDYDDGYCYGYVEYGDDVDGYGGNDGGGDGDGCAHCDDDVMAMMLVMRTTMTILT